MRSKFFFGIAEAISTKKLQVDCSLFLFPKGFHNFSYTLQNFIALS